MSYSFEGIPRVVWGTGYKNYGDINAKETALSRMAGETHVFIDQGWLRSYAPSVYSLYLKREKTTLYKFGYQAWAVPVKYASDILNRFPVGMFSEFMLRDTSLMGADAGYAISGQNRKVHLVLDFDGGGGTDHCYD